LGGVGSIAAAPFTGGLSLASLPGILGGASQIIGGLSQGRAQGQLQQGTLQLGQDKLAVERQRLINDAIQQWYENQRSGAQQDFTNNINLYGLGEQAKQGNFRNALDLYGLGEAGKQNQFTNQLGLYDRGEAAKQLGFKNALDLFNLNATLP